MNKISREELYTQVWRKPITHIAKEYGISDSAIIKICKKMDIPRPRPGHWAKIKHGQIIKQTPLSKLKKSGIEEYTITGFSNSTSDSNRTIKHPLVIFEQNKSNAITVNETADPHPLYLKNIKSFNNAKADENLKLQPQAKNHFDLSVTKGSLDRSLKLMSALLNAFEIRGWAFKYIHDPALKMQVIILDEAIEFSIHETLRQINHVLTPDEIESKRRWKHSWTHKWDYIPSDRLTLKIDNARYLINRQSWRDGKVQRIEQCLNKFCISAIQLAEALKVDRAKKAAEKIRYEKEQIERARLRDLREIEINKRKIFDQQLDAWGKAEHFRKYIHAVDLLDMETFTIGETQVSKQEWLAWAHNYSDQIDPLKDATPTIIEKTAGMFWSGY